MFYLWYDGCLVAVVVVYYVLVAVLTWFCCVGWLVVLFGLF